MFHVKQSPESGIRARYATATGMANSLSATNPDESFYGGK